MVAFVGLRWGAEWVPLVSVEGGGVMVAFVLFGEGVVQDLSAALGRKGLPAVLGSTRRGGVPVWFEVCGRGEVLVVVVFGGLGRAGELVVFGAFGGGGMLDVLG